MARYIDADKIVFWIRHVSSNGMLCDTDVRKVAFSDEIARIPTADVAPRAEVAREIFEEIEREITDALKSNYKVLPQVEESEALWNNVNGKINALGGIRYFIEELEKKYTGESP